MASTKNALWTLRESRKHGMTAEFLAEFRRRAEADGLETIDALVRAMRHYIDAPRPLQPIARSTVDEPETR